MMMAVLQPMTLNDCDGKMGRDSGDLMSTQNDQK
jgi:hypothetical protein